MYIQKSLFPESGVAENNKVQSIAVHLPIDCNLFLWMA
jgi:hypothetical protein